MLLTGQLALVRRSLHCFHIGVFNQSPRCQLKCFSMQPWPQCPPLSMLVAAKTKPAWQTWNEGGEEGGPMIAWRRGLDSLRPNSSVSRTEWRHSRCSFYWEVAFTGSCKPLKCSQCELRFQLVWPVWSEVAFNRITVNKLQCQIMSMSIISSRKDFWCQDFTMADYFVAA